MDSFSKMNQIGGTGVVGPGVSPGAGKNSPLPGGGSGPSFRETLDGLQKPPSKVPSNIDPRLAVSPLETENSAQSLNFSKHAIDRMRTRGIGMGPDKISRLEKAFEMADAKGSKDTLVLLDDNAFIMSVKNKTVVTAMDQSMLKENLFTNIDSTVMV